VPAVRECPEVRVSGNVPVRASAILGRSGRYQEGQETARGQQATFADAPRVFVLNVRNREGNPAAGGQDQPLAGASHASEKRPFR